MRKLTQADRYALKLTTERGANAEEDGAEWTADGAEWTADGAALWLDERAGHMLRTSRRAAINGAGYARELRDAFDAGNVSAARRALRMASAELRDVEVFRQHARACGRVAQMLRDVATDGNTTAAEAVAEITGAR